MGVLAAAKPDVLDHGIAQKFAAAIWRESFRKMSRHYVHLSPDAETALKLGKRHGTPIVFKVDALRMHQAGHRFFRSANAVWLVACVPPEFLEPIS